VTGTLTLAIALLVAATILATAAKRASVPYNVALVVAGLALALSGLLPRGVELAPEVVFLVCLPALLVEGGITADLGHIRENVVPIALLSTRDGLAVGGPAPPHTSRSSSPGRSRSCRRGPHPRLGLWPSGATWPLAGIMDELHRGPRSSRGALRVGRLPGEPPRARRGAPLARPRRQAARIGSFCACGHA
jgi:hypothetical protein